MKISSFFTALYYSFFSKEFYQMVAKDSERKAFIFIFILSAFCTFLPQAYLWSKVTRLNFENIKAATEDKTLKLNNKTEEYIKNIISQIPPMEINKEGVTIDSAGPVVIEDPITSKPLVIIDPNAKEGEALKSLATIFINKNSVFFRYKNDKPVQIFFNDLLNKLKLASLNINSKIVVDKLIAFRSSLLLIIPLMIFPILTGLSYIYSVIKAIFYSFLGAITLKLFDKNTNFRTILKLALVSLAPSIMAKSFLAIFFSNILSNQAIDFITSILFLGYFYFAIKEPLKPNENSI